MIEQTRSDNVRQAILTNIRRQLAASEPFDRIRAGQHPHEQKTSILAAETSFVENAPIAIPVDFETGSLPKRFQDALAAVGANCAIVRNEIEAAKIVEQVIAEKNARRIAVSNSVAAQAIKSLIETNAQILEDAAAAQLFDADIGITGAQWAIAETGTLVLESEKENHRLASLVPPVHICLIRAAQIRQTLGEILRLTKENLNRTITFITGASRTSDIELTLAVGVHGPAELHVIVIDEESK